MKKSIQLIGMILSILLLISACQGGPEVSPQTDTVLDPHNPVTVVLWHYYVGDNKISLENLVEEFNRTVGMEHGVIVTAIAKGSIAELEEAVTNSAMGVINADPMPEVFSSYPDKALEIDQMGKLCDLNDYFTEVDKALFVSDFLHDGLFENGRLLLVPIVKSTEQLYMNATAWEAFAAEHDFGLGDLITWEGLYEVSRAYYQWTNQGLWEGESFFGVDSLPNYIIIGSKQMGVNVIDAAGEQAVLDRAALGPLFERYYSGMSLGYWGAAGRFRSDDIKSGDLVAYVGSTSSAGYFPTWIEVDNTQQPIDFMALSYPHFEQGEAWSVQQGAGMCVSVSTEAKQEGAALFLKWFTAQEQNIPFAMSTGYLPVQKASYEGAAFEALLDELYAGDETQQNIAAVYEIALYQITETNTYAVQPFEGSYDIRTILEDTLAAAVAAGKERAGTLKAQGLSEEEILAALDVEASFAAWMQTICDELEHYEIPYLVR